MERRKTTGVHSDGVTVGSLCTGYGGLDMAAMAVLGGRLTWCSDNDRHVSRILAARFPGVPNLGDLTVIDWEHVEPVDVLCAGFPCQDISYAGRGAGIRKGTRSGIWINISEGIRTLRPKVVIVENVAAIRSRGLGKVLEDLATLGYDARWTSLRASDVGAAHRRERVFILAYRPEGRALLEVAADTSGQRQAGWSVGQPASGWRAPGAAHGPDGDAVSVTERNAKAPTVADADRERRNEGTDWIPQQAGRIVAAANGDRAHGGAAGSVATNKLVLPWGVYEPAIRRWEALMGRLVPQPTERGTRGQTRLSPQFVEWLMGLPAGYMTALGLPYGAQLHALGNGVMPQQAARAIRLLVVADPPCQVREAQ
jgi:DNA (cytosine-5)-methyltransferase 1